MAGRSSLVPVPNTSFAGHQSLVEENLDFCRYSAPELQWPEGYGAEKAVITKESDVYGMAMVIYEVFPIDPSPSNPQLDLTSIS